ncbi:MAG: hypothetical protein ABFD89_18890 [Bryobacteraceae bacterium]
MAAKDIAHRRKVRTLEAKRDALMERATKTKMDLAQTRAALKQQRKTR